MFDTLGYAKKLENAGVIREHAEAHVRVLADVINGNLATKEDIRDLRNIDIRDLKHEMKELEYRLVIKLGATVTLAIATMAAIVKFF
jgi:hypothetical protein